LFEFTIKYFKNLYSIENLGGSTSSLRNCYHLDIIYMNGKATMSLLFFNYPNRKTPTSTSGSDTPYSASVGVESSGDYRRSRDPNRNTHRRRIEYRQAAFPNRNTWRRRR